MFDYPGRDWPRQNCERIIGLPALCERLLSVEGGDVRISYQGELTSKHFGEWASLMLAWSQYAPVTAIAEELADVVHAGKAPTGWGELVRGGLAYGNTIMGITQRPQETDKTIFGNATELRIFRCNTTKDAKYISDLTGLPFDAISGLKQLEYIEKHDTSDDFQKKKITF